MFLLHCAAAAHRQHCEQLLRLLALRPRELDMEAVLTVAEAFADAFVTLQVCADRALEAVT